MNVRKTFSKGEIIFSFLEVIGSKEPCKTSEQITITKIIEKISYGKFSDPNVEIAYVAKTIDATPRRPPKLTKAI